MRKQLVFIYGSLRSGNAGEMSLRFPDSKFVADAQVKGSLYDLGVYPGLLLNEANSSVVGEVYEVNDETLIELDQFEASSDYVRKQVEAEAGKEGMKCWVYVPAHDSDFYSGRKLITSGDWMEYAKTKESERSSRLVAEKQLNR